MLAETLTRLALRAAAPGYDPRHAILDIAADLLATEDSGAAVGPLPADLAEELQRLRDDVRHVLPRYPSRRDTSVLFDRVGLGRTGVDRADRLVQRLVSLARSVSKSQRPAS